MLLVTSETYSIKVYHICIVPCLIAYACASAYATQGDSNLLPMKSDNNGANNKKLVATEGKTFQISSNSNDGGKIEDTVLPIRFPTAINGSLSLPDKAELNVTKHEDDLSMNYSQPTKLGYDALRRLLLVSVGITAVVVIYCTVQYIRLRRKKSAALKYGLLASHDEDLEMTPLEADEEEEETTLFDMKNHFGS